MHEMRGCVPQMTAVVKVRGQSWVERMFASVLLRLNMQVAVTL